MAHGKHELVVGSGTAHGMENWTWPRITVKRLRKIKDVQWKYLDAVRSMNFIVLVASLAYKVWRSFRALGVDTYLWKN